MRVNGVGTFREHFDPSLQGKIFHRFWLLELVPREKLLLVRCLVVAVALVASAVAQDNRSTTVASPPVSAQQPAEARPNGAGSQADTTSPQEPQTEGGGFVFRKEVEEVALR